jgi:release factor glutamine methyltransferase
VSVARDASITEGGALRSGDGPTHGAITRCEALTRARARLNQAQVDAPEREAEWLLLHALGIPPVALWSEPHAPVAADREAVLESLIQRREGREPLQLILGEVPFHGIALAVEPGVFVPRPETEELVEVVLERIAAMRVARGRLLDWGTGTGAIAVAVAKALPGWTVTAADWSPIARCLAARNAERNGVEARVEVVAGDFDVPEPVTSRRTLFDVVVSNPPYVRRGDIPGLMPEVRDHDPREALDGGPDGLDAFRSLARGMHAWLRTGGLLALEIGADQADNVLGILSVPILDARVLPDRAGHPRYVIGTMRGGGA